MPTTPSTPTNNVSTNERDVFEHYINEFGLPNTLVATKAFVTLSSSIAGDGIEGIDSNAAYTDKALDAYHALGLFAQNIEIAYRCPVREIFEITTTGRGIVIGHPSGTCQIQHLAGPTPIADAAYRQLGDPSNYAKNILRIQYSMETEANAGEVAANCGGEYNGQPMPHKIIELSNAIMEQYSLSLKSNDMTMTDNATIKFTYMNMREMPN